MRHRQRLQVMIATLFFSAVCFGLPGQPAADEAYTVTDYAIEARLDEDGSAHVEEQITFTVHEDRRDYRFRIPYEQNTAIAFAKLTISALEAESDYFLEATLVDAQDDEALPMTYTLTDDGEAWHLQFHVFSAANSTRTIHLSYDLIGLVERHHDTARLQHAFFDTGLSGTVDEPQLTLALPAQPEDDFETPWFLVREDGSWTMEKEDDALRFQAPQLDLQKGMTVITLLPLEFFAAASEASSPSDRQSLIAAIESEERAPDRMVFDWQAPFFVIHLGFLLALILALILYWAFDHESAASYHQRISRDLPTDLPPALIAKLLRRHRTSRLILATLMDLVRRGALQRDGYIFSRNPATVEPYVGFQAYEIFLINWLFDQIATGEDLSLSELRQYARDEKTSAKFRAYHQQFQRLLREALEEQGLIDDTRTRQGRFYSRIFAAVYGLAAVVLALLLADASLWIFLLPALFFGVYSLFLRRLTRKGVEGYARSQAVYFGLKKPCRFNPSPNAAYFASALPLSVALGCYESLLQAMPDLIPATQDQDATSLMIYGLRDSGFLAEKIKDLSEDLKTMESIIHSSILLAGSLNV